MFLILNYPFQEISASLNAKGIPSSLGQSNLRKTNVMNMNLKTYPQMGPETYIGYEDKRIPSSISTDPPENRTPLEDDVFTFDSGIQLNIGTNRLALTTRSESSQMRVKSVETQTGKVEVPGISTIN